MTTVLDALGLETEIKDWVAELSINPDGTCNIQWHNRKRGVSLVRAVDIPTEHLPLVCAGMVGDVRQAAGITNLSMEYGKQTVPSSGDKEEEKIGSVIEDLYNKGALVWLKRQDVREQLEPYRNKIGDIPILCTLGAVSKLLT